MNNVQPDPSKHELLSALADGELRNSELNALFAADGDGPELRCEWNVYQVVGQLLRSPAGHGVSADAVFLSKLNQRLAQEKPLGNLSAISDMTGDSRVSDLPGKSLSRQTASNDSAFRWKMVAGFASLAAVSAIGWSTISLTDTSSRIAQTPPATLPEQQVLVASPQGPVVRDARLEELLTAHKQAGGMSAFQVPSGFLRNATFESPQNAGR